MFTLHRFKTLGLTALCSFSLLLIINQASSAASLPYVPTTTVSGQTSVNTSASAAFTDIYYSFNTGAVGPNANGDMVPANISKLPINSLLTGAAASAPVWVETQTWFCHNASNEGSNGLIISGTAPDKLKCGSHIDIGYNSGDATQIANTVSDLISRGIQGVVMDWEGPPVLSTGQTNVQNNNSVDQIEVQARASGGKFQFAVQEDEGAAGCVNGWWPCRCADGTTGASCNSTTQAIFDINYLLNRWAGSPSYLHSNGSPVVYVFLADSVGVDWDTVWAGLGTDPVTGKSPLFIFENSGGMNKPHSGGAYSWLNTTGWTSYPGSDPFGLNWLISDFASVIKSWNANPSLLVTASAFKGFDDTVVNGWGGLAPLPGPTPKPSSASNTSRYIDQQCGLTWLESFAQISKSFSAKAPDFISIPTWDDYEEATEVQTGIDNCLTSLSPIVSGSVVSWSPVFGSSLYGYPGNETTVHHYVVYVSQDGENLMALPNVASGTHTLNLSQFGLPPGTYQVFVQAVGQPMIRNYFIAASGTYQVASTLGAISGQITNASSGAPVPDASVSYPGGSVATNSSGQYTISGVSPGSYTVQVAASGYSSGSGTVSVAAGATSTFNLAIAATGLISGTVESSSGAGISGATVSISGGVIATSASLTASATGGFTTSAIPTGTYTVNCSAPGYGSGTVSATVSAGATANPVCVLKSSTGTISGQITNASGGTPVSGATVSYPGGSATTNSSGQYTLSSVSPGSYAIQVAASGYLGGSGHVSVTAGSTATFNLAIATSGSISGTVESSSGAAISGAAVNLSGGVISTTENFTSSATGGFSISWIPVGTYTVSCSAPGYSPGSVSATISAGKTVNPVCVLKSLTGSISGQVTNISGGAPVSGATVSYSGGSATTGSSGQYTISGVSPGSYAVQVAASGYLSGSGTVSVAAGAASTFNLAITTAGMISGTVQSSSGGEIPGATVSLSGGVIATSVSLTSNSSGEFSTSWIPVGTYNVSCTAPGYSSSFLSATVSAGATANPVCVLKKLVGSISGQITNATKSPVSGASVSYSGGSTTTDSSGHYTFASVSPGSYAVQIAESGYLSSSGTVSVTAGAVSTFNLAIAPAGMISGTVETTWGALIPDVTVTLKGGVSSTTVNVTTDSNGKFITSWIPIGTYTVSCPVAGYTSSPVTVNLTAGDMPMIQIREDRPVPITRPTGGPVRPIGERF